MKRIITAILVALLLITSPVLADECEGTWLVDAAKSGNIDILSRAKARAVVCAIKYASEAVAIMSLKNEIEREQKNEPSSRALRRLKEVARKGSESTSNLAVEFEQAQNILGALINIEIAKRILEQSKKPNVTS